VVEVIEGDTVFRRLVEELNNAPAAAMLDVAYEVLSEPLGLRHLWLYMADYSEQKLEPVPCRFNPPPPDPISIRGSLPGRAYLSRAPTEAEGDGQGGPILWVPVVQRSDSIGVLGLGVKAHSDEVPSWASALGALIGGAVVGARRHADVFEMSKGAGQLRLAAMMQWDLLPMPSYADSGLHIAGGLEPAYDIAGDSFDFAANDGRLDLAIFDAMGHGLGATLLTTLAVGAYRLARRRLRSLPEMAKDVDRAVAFQGDGEAFVTGHLCALDVRAGRLEWINVGHPLPVLIRNHASMEIGPADPMLPFGLDGAPPKPTQIQLEPADILLFYSDGVVDAVSRHGEPYGLARLVDQAGRHYAGGASLAPGVRHILDEVKEHAENRLRDDGTVLAVRWLGREPA
jgi:Stage II sporulation protein E (SpoIIE)